MSQRWRLQGGEVTIPGDVPSGLPCPVVVERGEIHSANITNNTDLRIYVAGASNLEFKEEFLGVLLPGASERAHTQHMFRLWVIPENWDPTGCLDLERKEVYDAGYDDWRQKHALWHEQRSKAAGSLKIPSSRRVPRKESESGGPSRRFSL